MSLEGKKKKDKTTSKIKNTKEVKCEICGETTHSTYQKDNKPTPHLLKSNLYDLFGHKLQLKDRSFYSGEELADVAASYLGRPIIFVKKKATKRIGIFRKAPATMIYEAWPKPAKFIDKDGDITWHTNKIDNLPKDAKEYKLQKNCFDVNAKVISQTTGETTLVKDIERPFVFNDGTKMKIINTTKERPFLVYLWDKNVFESVIPKGFKLTRVAE